MLVTVLTRRQALQLRNFLRRTTPRSFITIVNSSEIIGKGASAPLIKRHGRATPLLTNRSKNDILYSDGAAVPPDAGVLRSW